MKSEESKIYDFIVNNNIATEEEINLCTYVAGWTVETLNGIIYARTLYHNVRQCLICEPESYEDINNDFNGIEE